MFYLGFIAGDYSTVRTSICLHQMLKYRIYGLLDKRYGGSPPLERSDLEYMNIVFTAPH